MAQLLIKHHLDEKKELDLLAGKTYSFSLTQFTDQEVFLELWDGSDWVNVHEDAVTADWFDCFKTPVNKFRFRVDAGTPTGLILNLSLSQT